MLYEVITIIGRNSIFVRPLYHRVFCGIDVFLLYRTITRDKAVTVRRVKTRLDNSIQEPHRKRGFIAVIARIFGGNHLGQIDLYSADSVKAFLNMARFESKLLLI